MSLKSSWGGRENLWNFLLFLLLILTSPHLSLSFGRWAEKRGGKKKNFLSYFSYLSRAARRRGRRRRRNSQDSKSAPYAEKKERLFFVFLSLSLFVRDRHPRQDERRKRNTVKEGEGTSSLLWRQGGREGHTYTQKKREDKVWQLPLLRKKSEIETLLLLLLFSVSRKLGDFALLSSRRSRPAFLP